MKAELLILGVLHRGNFHPYEIKRRLRNAMIECYTDVDVGTLYYAVRQLEKNGLIIAVRQERVARGGVRTVYGISPIGKRRFEQLLNEQFATEGSVAQTLYAPMLFLQFSNLPLIADLLRTRISRETPAIREIIKIREQLGSTLATGALHLLKHLELQHRLDRNWLQGVLADVEGGRVRDVADTKRLARGWLASKTQPRQRSRRSSGSPDLTPKLTARARTV
jgi:DNA-binding PadR family transcriptional regulator